MSSDISQSYALHRVESGQTVAVRSFDELTETGRLRRLRRFAEEVVVSRYGIAKPRVRLLSKHSFNTVFRVDTDRERYVLRVGDATRIHSFGVEDVEAPWLNHLHFDTAIVAPRPIASTSNSWRVDFETSYVTGQRACSMFTFLEGRELRKTERVDASSAYLAGALLARMHEDAATALPPIPITPQLRADRVVYFHEENLIGEYRSNYGGLFRDALDRVQASIDALWQSPPHSPHLLHGDFGTHNLMIWRDELRPIDFQDLQFGFDLQDLAISLADLKRRTPELVDNFQEGYRSVRAWPELSPALLATLVAGRSLNIMNLGLHLQREGIDWFLETHSNLIRDWMLRE